MRQSGRDERSCINAFRKRRSCKQTVKCYNCLTMADNNDLLQQIRTIVREENEPLKQAQAQTNTRVDALATGQAQTNATLSQIKTTVEALEAGQEDIREKMATKADIHRLEHKIDKVDKGVKSHESRIDNLEEDAGIPNPHKN